MSKAKILKGKKEADLVNDCTLDALDTNWLLVDPQNTSTFTRGGTHAASELGEIVGHEKTIESISPLTLEDQVVPLGNDVRDWAPSI